MSRGCVSDVTWIKLRTRKPGASGGVSDVTWITPPPACFSTVYLETTNGSLLHYRASPGFKHEIIRAFVNVIPRIRVIEQDSS